MRKHPVDKFLSFKIFSLLSYGFVATVTGNAYAACISEKCENVHVKKLITSSNGNIYIEISDSNISTMCQPATVEGYEGINFLTLPMDTLNYSASTAILRIAHEQQRPLREIRATGAECRIWLINSSL